MLYRLCMIAVLLGLMVGLTAGEAASVDKEGAMRSQTSADWRESRLAQGKEVYEYACAACHDEGLNGAPPIGDREAWSDRSPLWSAVLFEHARTGYLEMPAKGSHEDLSDQQVDAAAEYLLSVTFPELPLD